MKSILILGAGLVVKPMVDYFLSKNYMLTIADLDVSKAKNLILNNSQVITISLDVTKEPEKLDELISGHDITLNLLPPYFMPFIAEFCVTNKKDLIGTNYLSQETKNLDILAKAAGITIIDEVGVDPGIDHMIAKKIIDEVHAKKGRVISFKSYCGGLPAPGSNDNPLGYKFSWSPRGVLVASKRNATFKENNLITTIIGKELFKKANTTHLTIDEIIGTLEVYANSDSLKYIDLYDIPEVESVFRATLRYQGWSEILQALVDLNYLSLDLYDTNCTYSQYLSKLISADPEDIKKTVAQFLKISEYSGLISKLDWLGLFSTEIIQIKEKQISPLDLLTKIMLKVMTYKPEETDLLVLINEFKVSYKDKHTELIKTSLIEYGERNGYSAMAKTVSYPVIICTELLLEGKISQKGVLIPITKEIYEPVLNRLKDFGINFTISKQND